MSTVPTGMNSCGRSVTYTPAVARTAARKVHRTRSPASFQNLPILIPHLIDLVKSLLVEYAGDRQLEQHLHSTDLHPCSLVDTTSNGKMERALSIAHAPSSHYWWYRRGY